MTGATGDLTPDDIQRDQEPAVRREMEPAPVDAESQPEGEPPRDGMAHLGGDAIADEESHL